MRSETRLAIQRRQHRWTLILGRLLLWPTASGQQLSGSKAPIRVEGEARPAGLTDPRVFRSSDDPNEVVIFFNTNDTAKAKDFVAWSDLKSTMARAGVADRTSFYFLESTEPLRGMGSGWIELLGLKA